MAFGFAGLLISSISMTMRYGSVPRGRVRLTILSIVGATLLGFRFWIHRVLDNFGASDLASQSGGCCRRRECSPP